MRSSRGYTNRGNSFRGSRGGRGIPWNTGGRGRGRGEYTDFRRNSRDHYSSSSSFDGRYDKGRFNENNYSRDDYHQHKQYRMDVYPKERHSPERKRQRMEGPSRHDYSGGNSRYESYPPERSNRGFSGDRHISAAYVSRKEDFRKPPPQSARGGGRGRLTSRGSRGIHRERGRRLSEKSYSIRKRGSMRGDYSGRSTKLIRMRSALIRHEQDDFSSEKESSGEEEKMVVVKKESDLEVLQEGPDKEEEAKVDELEDHAIDEQPKEAEKSDLPEKLYIKLVCPHCNVRTATFRRYEMHLEGKAHMFAMRKVAAKQRSILAQMRQAQRNAQNDLEKSGEGITEHTVFCPLCKLNYKQERAVHQATSAHKNMKKFLMPTCKVCKETFKSPMIYEHHLASVDHIKRKQRKENAGEGEEDNLDEFTTIDSVGEVPEENQASTEEKEEEKKKKKVSVGIEKIRKIEAYHCDLCRMFLPRGTENEYPDILAAHCRKRFHMQRYIRLKQNEDIKKRAEKLQRKENEEKLKNAEEKKNALEVKEPTEESKVSEEPEPKESDPKEVSKITDDDKVWDIVDKDLGELLEETDVRDDDDDEERIDGERYDRFRSAEKEKNGEEKETEDSKEPEETKDPEENK